LYAHSNSLRYFHSLTWTPFGTLASELLACFLFLALYSFQGAHPLLLLFRALAAPSFCLFPATASLV